MRSIWMFISDHLLKMKWLNDLVGKILETFGLNIDSMLGGALQFFIYDVIKIVILLCMLIFLISYVQSFFPPEKTKRILGRFKGLKGNIMGALLGTITPFCSCSSIPVFIGFVSSGMPIGVTISFLISSPFVDLASMLLLMTLFGPKIAITYMIVGIILAVVGGLIVEKLGYGEHIHDFVKKAKSGDAEEIKMTRQERISYSYQQMMETLRKVFIFILIGVGIGALIHNVIPEEIITNVIGTNNPFAPILAGLVAIPIYADIFGTLPIAEALHLKNVPIGTILTFMMGVTALSLPSMVMLSKVMKPKLLTAFIAIISIGIVLIGYLFNVFGHLII